MFSVGEYGNFKMGVGRWHASAGNREILPQSLLLYTVYIYTVFQYVHHSLKCVTCGYKSHLKYVKMSIKKYIIIQYNAHVSTTSQNMDMSHILWISHIQTRVWFSPRTRDTYPYCRAFGQWNCHYLFQRLKFDPTWDQGPV